MAESTAERSARAPWYRALNATQWNTLFAANLGWLFDGYETYALILTVGPALRELLDPSLYPRIPAYAGSVIALTLLGWGIGGLIGGILADYIGRKRMMIAAIIAYSAMTGLSALAQDWTSFAVLRFLVGIAIGSEWATGTAMMAELWPNHARGKGAGLMQCGLGVGFFLASLAWLFLGTTGPGAWRTMYVLGIVPALVTLWIRRSMPESPLWESVNKQRRAARALLTGSGGSPLTRSSGAPKSAPLERPLPQGERANPGGTPSHFAITPDAAQARKLTRFTLVELFADPESRRRTVVVLLMSLTTTLCWWGISSWVPPYIAQQAVAAGLSGERWASYAGMAYNLGAIAGYVGYGFLADRFGRKPVTALFFAAALLMTPVLFLWARDLELLLVVAAANAFFSLGQYSWMPTWLPELYPTRVRATAVAFAFNAPRFVAFLGPLVAGTLIAEFGGYGNAAVSVATIYLLGLSAVWFVPETKGKALPE